MDSEKQTEQDQEVKPEEMIEACGAFGVELPEDSLAMIDKLEATLIREFPKIECPLDHVFTPGLYTRVILMKAGSLITSKIHKTEHPFVVLKGKVSVWTKEAGAVTIEAPFLGVTQPGTKRVLYIHEDTIWATFHPTELKTVEEIEEVIIEKRVNPLLENPCPALT